MRLSFPTLNTTEITKSEIFQPGFIQPDLSIIFSWNMMCQTEKPANGIRKSLEDCIQIFDFSVGKRIELNPDFNFHILFVVFKEKSEGIS